MIHFKKPCCKVLYDTAEISDTLKLSNKGSFNFEPEYYKEGNASWEYVSLLSLLLLLLLLTMIWLRKIV